MFTVICSLVWIQIGRFLSRTQSHILDGRQKAASADQKVIKLPRKTALCRRRGVDEEPDDGGRGREKVLYEEVMKKVLYGTSSFTKPTKEEDALRKLSTGISTVPMIFSQKGPQLNFINIKQYQRVETEIRLEI